MPKGNGISVLVWENMRYKEMQRQEEQTTSLFCFAEPGSAQLSRVGEMSSQLGTRHSMVGSPAASCSQEGVPRTSERKTWQVTWELDAKGEGLGIKNDHFPEIKTKTRHQFLPCITEDVGIPTHISSMIQSLTSPFMLTCTGFFTIYQKEKAGVLFTEWYK